MANAVGSRERHGSGAGDSGVSIDSQKETMETLSSDVLDGYSSDDDGVGASQSKVWGRLFPVGTSFRALGL